MPHKVLIIEEDRTNLKLFSEILGYNGYETLEAMTVLEGISLAMSEKPQLILMGIDTPVSNGLEIFKIMKSDVIPSEARNLILSDKIATSLRSSQ